MRKEVNVKKEMFKFMNLNTHVGCELINLGHACALRKGYVVLVKMYD